MPPPTLVTPPVWVAAPAELVVPPLTVVTPPVWVAAPAELVVPPLTVVTPPVWVAAPPELVVVGPDPFAQAAPRLRNEAKSQGQSGFRTSKLKWFVTGTNSSDLFLQ